MGKKKQETKGELSTMDLDLKSQRLDLKSILKDIEHMAPSYMTWKEKKEMEDRKIVSLGGKPPKKQRLPLSVARVQMKKQNEREQKMNAMLERYGGKIERSTTKGPEKRKPEDRVLKSTVGQFKNGILDVKHLLRPTESRDKGDTSRHGFGKGKKKKGGKKKQGKRKGGGHKR